MTLDRIAPATRTATAFGRKPLRPRLRDGTRAGRGPRCSALLAATAVLYLWGLGSSGWANSYYAAAAQAGTQDWKAWLFGSLDAGNAITVDKPPAATVGDGLVRAAVRLHRVHDAPAAGFDGGGGSRRAVRDGAPRPADQVRVSSPVRYWPSPRSRR